MNITTVATGDFSSLRLSILPLTVSGSKKPGAKVPRGIIVEGVLAIKRLRSWGVSTQWTHGARGLLSPSIALRRATSGGKQALLVSYNFNGNVYPYASRWT